ARWAMIHESDAGLIATAQALAGFAEVSKGHLILDAEVADFRQFAAGSRRAFYEFWAPDGTVLHRSPSLRGRDMPRFRCRPNRPEFYSLTLPTGRSGRAIARQFQPRPDDNEQGPRPAVTLVLAQETRELDEHLTALAWLLASAGAATMLTATLVALVAVNRGLRPVRALAADIGAIDADRLAQRVPTDAIPTELLPVGEKLNAMLTRLEAAFHRERTFTSDVAHELRTPLAGARTTFEVALSRPREAHEYAEALRDGLAALLPMQTLIQNLLTLARLDNGQAAIDRQDVDLAQLARSYWSEVAPKADARGLRLEEDLPSTLILATDRQCLLLVLRNLLDNAVAYADSGGLIRLTARPGSGGVELTIANTGCTLTPADIPRVFDRFWRGDAARTDTELHCGLGLSLVQRALAAIGGTICATLEAPATFVVRIKLPPCP
ncbi:MAG: ATP-binding protein, partial [Planctomycetota bacterium]